MKSRFLCAIAILHEVSVIYSAEVSLYTSWPLLQSGPVADICRCTQSLNTGINHCPKSENPDV